MRILELFSRSFTSPSIIMAGSSDCHNYRSYVKIDLNPKFLLIPWILNAMDSSSKKSRQSLSLAKRKGTSKFISVWWGRWGQGESKAAIRPYKPNIYWSYYFKKMTICTISNIRNVIKSSSTTIRTIYCLNFIIWLLQKSINGNY